MQYTFTKSKREYEGLKKKERKKKKNNNNIQI